MSTFDELARPRSERTPEQNAAIETVSAAVASAEAVLFANLDAFDLESDVVHAALRLTAGDDVADAYLVWAGPL